MTETIQQKIANRRRLCMTAEQWADHDFSQEETPIIGTPEKQVISQRTKNLLVAPEKSFKTTFLMRLGVSLASGETLFPEFPVNRSYRVLYVHAELNPSQIKKRVQAAVANVDTQGQFINVRDIFVHLIATEGQNLLREYIEETKPDVVILDPWQELIVGISENSDDIGAARKFMDELIDTYGVTIILSQHTGRDASKGGRGHSSLKGWRDTEMQLSRKGDLITVNVDPRWSERFVFTAAFKDGTVHPKGLLFSEKDQKLRDWLKSYPGGAALNQIMTAFDMRESAARKMVDRASECVPPAVIKKEVDGKVRVFHSDFHETQEEL